MEIARRDRLISEEQACDGANAGKPEFSGDRVDTYATSRSSAVQAKQICSTWR